MVRSPILVTYLLSSVVIIGIAHYVALKYTLYFEFPWLDIPMHLLGGAIIALIFLLLHVYIPQLSRYSGFFPALMFVLLVGLLWELFEIYIGIPLIEGNFELDMIADLINDLIGGAMGYFVGRKVNELETWHD